MKFLPLLFFLWYPRALLSQEYPRQEIDLNRITDELYGFQDGELNYEELYENVMQVLSNPIDLNTATEEDLRFLNLLSTSQIKNLVAYRKEFNSFLSIYELQAIPAFDLQTILKLAPFVKVINHAGISDISYWKNLWKDNDNYLLIRQERTLQERRGNGNLVNGGDRFQGSPDKLYLRFRSSKPGDFSVGFTAEKDAGEPLRWDASKHYYGLDYLSCHLQLQHKGRLKNLVVGDYQIQFGQGLMFGGILGMGKGSETITTVRRSNLGITPYTAVYEAGFLRGIAATAEVAKHVLVSTFYSRTRRDATSSADSASSSIISSFQTSGLHRNDRELAIRKKISDENWGVVVQYKTNQLDLGVMFNNVSYEAPVVHSPNVYNQFAFEGIRNTNVGLFLNYTFDNLAFFSEASCTLEKGKALTAGMLWSAASKVDISLSYRRFDRDYHSFYSNAFAEGSTTQNENGMYWGLKYRINKEIMLSGYVDLFQFPWLRYRSYAPSSGHEWLVRLSYQPSRNVLIFIQGREESKERNIAAQNSALYRTGQGIKHNYWIHVDYGLRQKLRLKTRAQFSTFEFSGRTTTGVALIQSIRWEFGKFKATAHYALFNTDDYDNRQYVYENDVYLAYAMPAYYTVGVRKVAMIEYKANRHISLWLRYAISRYPKENHIGSGLETISGNNKSDVKLQVRIKF